MPKTHTFSECYKLLDVDPKTFGRWLEKAGIDPKQQVSKVDNRIRFLTQAQVDQLATDHGRTLAPREEQPQEESVASGAFKLFVERLAERLTTVEQELSAQRDSLATHMFIISNLQEHVATLQEQLTQAQETIATLQAPRRTTKVQKPSETADTLLPEGLVAWRTFADLHKAPQTTAGRYIEQGLIHVIRGKWKIGGGYVKEALDAPGRRDFWVQFHSKEGFSSCDDCPHEITQP